MTYKYLQQERSTKMPIRNISYTRSHDVSLTIPKHIFIDDDAKRGTPGFYYLEDADDNIYLHYIDSDGKARKYKFNSSFGDTCDYNVISSDDADEDDFEDGEDVDYSDDDDDDDDDDDKKDDDDDDDDDKKDDD